MEGLGVIGTSAVVSTCRLAVMLNGEKSIVEREALLGLSN
jgi:hypothetical protein